DIRQVAWVPLGLATQLRLAFSMFVFPHPAFTPQRRGIFKRALTGNGTECRKQQLKAAGELAGLMPLATTPFFSAWLCAPALDGFLHAHPGLRVELMEDRRNLDISRREADVAYGCCAHRHRGSSRGEWEKLPSPAIHTPPRRRHRPAE
ncbi:hypothetical protein ACI2VJ_24910, partial [Ralstonia nicotianae]